MTTKSDRARPSYAVIWRTGDGPVSPGKLVLGATSFRLETGGAGGRSTTEGIRYADLESVEKASSSQRIHGRPTTLVRRLEREPVAIAALDGPGSAHEIAERLAQTVQGGESASRLVLVLPLKEGTSARARELLAEGPPFELQATRLVRHEVYLTDREVVFVFEAAAGETPLRLVAGDPALRAAADAWRECMAGRPRKAEAAFSWIRPEG